MKKSGIVIIILSVLLVIAVCILIYGVFQGIKVKGIIVGLQERNNWLENDRTQISEDKNDLMAQFEECRTQSQTDHEKLNMIMQDLAQIEKSCPSGSGICSGKFSFLRYKCNEQGDAVDNGQRVCECDQNCELVVH